MTSTRGPRGVLRRRRSSAAGGVDREIRVSAPAHRLMALGIPAPGREGTAAIHEFHSGGRGEVGSREQTIRMLRAAWTSRNFQSAPIVLPGRSKRRLNDLPRSPMARRKARSFARLDGQPVVTFGIYRARLSPMWAVARPVSKSCRAHQQHPELSLSEIDRTVRYTKTDSRATMQTFEPKAQSLRSSSF